MLRGNKRARGPDLKQDWACFRHMWKRTTHNLVVCIQTHVHAPNNIMNEQRYVKERVDGDGARRAPPIIKILLLAINVTYFTQKPFEHYLHVFALLCHKDIKRLSPEFLHFTKQN